MKLINLLVWFSDVMFLFVLGWFLKLLFVINLVLNSLDSLGVVIGNLVRLLYNVGCWVGLLCCFDFIVVLWV